MSSTMDLIRAGAQQAASGKQLDSNTIDKGVETSESSAVLSDGDFVTGSESTMDDLLPGSEDTQADSGDGQKKAEEQASSEASTKPQTSDKEVITVTDETGRRKKVEIDYTDRKAIKKAHELSVGARKWQAERDQALAATKAKDEKLSELSGNWQVMEAAYKNGGVEGIIDLLEGRPGASKAWLDKQIERHNFLQNASPKELQELQSREQAEKDRKEIDKIRKENEEFKKSITADRETAELRSLESRVHPSFERHRFADKLGDPEGEQMFDEMLWNTALQRLEPYEAKGLDISPELVEREFRTVAVALRKRIGAQAEKKASKVIEQKKQDATEHVQSQIKAGYKTSGTAQEARNLIQSGNLTGLLKNWGKYGNLFNK